MRSRWVTRWDPHDGTGGGLRGTYKPASLLRPQPSPVTWLWWLPSGCGLDVGTWSELLPPLPTGDLSPFLRDAHTSLPLYTHVSAHLPCTQRRLVKALLGELRTHARVRLCGHPGAAWADRDGRTSMTSPPRGPGQPAGTGPTAHQAVPARALCPQWETARVPPFSSEC